MKRRLMALFLALTMLVSMAPGVCASDTGFSDVAPDAWYAEAVKWAVENGITGGIGNGMFGPDNTCTRGQVVTFLWAAAGKPVMENADNPFADVSASDWYYNAVMWAVS
ncbi:MAG: S-layer homology domain-containing protein, partial [Oscillospiraceae bacterium]|nr:S-layer homology domain-containing protein [Oscillospiraceae bacterium]